MKDFLQLILQALVATGVASLIVRKVATEAIKSAFETHRLQFSNDLKIQLESHKSALETRAEQEDDRFKYFFEKQAVVVVALVRDASELRRTILGIDRKRDLERAVRNYQAFCDHFYENQLLPKQIYDAAHEFRKAAEVAKGACAVAGEAPLADSVVQRLDETFSVLRAKASAMLLPTEPSPET